jgi:hypothetical protein
MVGSASSAPTIEKGETKMKLSTDKMSDERFWSLVESGLAVCGSCGDLTNVFYFDEIREGYICEDC